MDDLWLTLESTGLALFVKESVWAYPALETVHLLGLGLLFGGIVAFDLRVLGYATAIPLTPLARHVLPLVWTGFALNATSGILLFLSDAADFAANPAFRVKLALIVVAGLNALAFHATTRTLAASPAGAESRSARTSALISILTWILIVVAGRMIAYVATP